MAAAAALEELALEPNQVWEILTYEQVKRLSEVPMVSLWFILASCMAAGLIVAAMLLWVGINAMLHQHRLMGEPPITIASLGPALCAIYDGTARESLPADFFDLLRKLTNKAPVRQQPSELKPAGARFGNNVDVGRAI